MKNTYLTLLMLIPLVALSLIACQTKTSTVATKPACALYQPITYSASDTPETRLQIRKHNAAHDTYCGVK